MKASHFSIIFSAVVFAAPFGAFAQKAPQATVISATAPGQAAVGRSVQLQGKIQSIDGKDRNVVVVGPQGNTITFIVGKDARNFDQLRVDDLVTLTYDQAVVMELRKVENTGIREREESIRTDRSDAGQKPAATVERTIRAIADVTAIDPKAQTITLRGAQHTIELMVKDPTQLKDIKVGNQVEALYVEAVTLQVTAPNK